jgi:hypothetical protein
MDLLSQRHLAADASKRFGAGETVTFLEARDLGFAIGGDDDGLIDSLVDAGFEEERYVVDDDSVRVFSSGLPCEPFLFSRDAGMNYAFESTAFGWLAEYDSTERTAIEGAVWIEDGLAERFHDFSPSRFAGFDDVMGQFVGVDDDCAALLKHLGDGALAGRDAPCESNQNHGGGA